MMKSAPKIARWWTEEKGSEAVYKAVFSSVRNIFANSRERMDRNMRNLRLYGNMEVLGVGPGSYTQVTAPTLPENRVRMNLVSSMVDTSGAKISKIKPKVQFLTSGGDFTSQRQAKQLTKWTIGAFYQSKLHALHQQAFRDAQIFDIGAIKHYIEDGKVKSERVLPVELLVDAFDGLYGKPQTLFQMKYVGRENLITMYPEFEAAIRSYHDQIEDNVHTTDEVEQFVVVIESWHLPSTPKAKDGRHVIAIGNTVLSDDPWEKEYFPFTFFRWSKPVVGFFGESLAQRLTPIQLEVNKMLRTIQRAFHLGSGFKVFLERGSKVPKSHINNEIAAIVEYSGKPPIFYTPQTVHSEYFTHLKYLQQSAYEETGISQISASSKLPAGIDGGSGKALREYENLETERFSLVAQDYESTFLESATIYIDLAYDIQKAGGDFGVTAQSRAFVEKIKFSDVAPADKNAFIMQMFPTSMLPHEPAGRMAYVQELINSQMIPASVGAELLNFPDLDSYMDVKNTEMEDLLFTLEKLVEGEYLAPEPFQNLTAGIAFMQSAYLRARRDQVPEAGLENIRKWIASADAMNQKAAAAQAQMQAAAQGQATPAQPG